jgi:phage-related protein
MQSAFSAVTSAGAAILGWFTALPGRVFSAISAFVSGFPALTLQTINAAAFAVGAGIGRILTFFINFPGRALAAAARLTGLIVGLLQTTFSNTVAAVSNGVSRVIGFFSGLPGRARGAASSLPSQLLGLASSAMSSLVNRISSGIASAISVLRGLPGRARSALGSLGGALVSAGRDLVMGLVRGIQGAIGAAVSAAVGVGRSVINGIKSTLKIGSPSKIMISFGEWTSEGLAQGILNQIALVKQAAKSLAQTVVAPTINMPGTTALGSGTSSGRGVQPPAVPAVASGGGTRTYRLAIGGAEFASFVVDAITGAPIEVSKAANEGSRAGSWSGSGRQGR